MFLEVSAPALELLGRPADEVAGTFVGDWVDAEDQEDLQAPERDLADWGRATVALRVRRGDGTLCWVESTLYVAKPASRSRPGASSGRAGSGGVVSCCRSGPAQ